MKTSLAALAVLGFAAFSPVARAQGQYGDTGSGDGSMQSGGLSPPPPVNQDPESAKTEEKLEQAEQEDSGRGLEFFYLNAEIGAETLGLETFKANNIVDSNLARTKQTGLAVGAGLGLRLVFLTIGP